MVTVYKDLVESFGYTPVMEAVSLDAIMAAVGQEKDEQKRASTLNDIAWKENLPGLYDPVSGNFVRKQSMPARSGGRYDIAATASSGADKELADRGLVPDNASTSTAIGRMVRGDDKKQYDQDIRSRSQAARGEKPQGQGAQPGQVTDAGSEYGTKDAFDAKAHDDLANAMMQHGRDVQQRQGDDKPVPSTSMDTDSEAGAHAFDPTWGGTKPTGGQDTAPNANSRWDNATQTSVPNKPTPNNDLAAKRQRYADLLNKAKNSTVPSGSRM